MIFWGPVLTCSGYGTHARQLLCALDASGLFDISVKSVRWGDTAYVSDDDPFIEKIHQLIKKHENDLANGVKYDVSIQVTIPNEFQRLAPINIGVTAGIEVDRASPVWIQKINDNVDLLIVPSAHSANTIANIAYKSSDGHELKLMKPVLVVPESFDAAVFNQSKLSNISDLNLESEFNFLSVGLGLDRSVGEDRKNIGLLVKWFCETFAGDKRVGLVLKMSIVNNSLIDFETCKERLRQVKASTACGEFPRIKLIHGRLNNEQLASLYKHPKIKTYITLTHGEGFGLPILEAAACGLPVIATNWSGHLDFLHMPNGKRKFVPVEYDLAEIPAAAVWDGVMDRGTQWACPKEQDAKLKMKKVFLSSEKPTEWANELSTSLTKTHSSAVLGPAFVEAIQQFLGQIGRSSPMNTGAQRDARTQVRSQLEIPDGKKSLLYTMPMSAGDVFISTAVVDSLKKKFPEHLIYFATNQKYSSILKDNPNIERVIGYEQWMTDVPFCERVFDEVYTPNLAIQTNSANWIHGGKGRLLGDEMAAQCQVKFGEYHIKVEDVPGLPKKYVVVHPGSGNGQHEARNYRHWKKVIVNLKKNIDTEIVLVGAEGDLGFEGCIDLRGRTTYNQLAKVVADALCVVSIDSVVMHMARAFRRSIVAIFGSSYSTSTGPTSQYEQSGQNVTLLDTPDRMGCEKACYKYQCSVERDNPCINRIDPKHIVNCVISLMGGTFKYGSIDASETWDDCRPKIAGYTHVLNAETHGFPYIESIRSMLGFCDEVVVVDGGSNDGTVEKIKAIGDNRIKFYERKWDWSEPGMDGMQKAFGRAMCSIGPDDFLWQQDADEVVHEDDYGKVRALVERFPSDVDLLHLPVVELWGDDRTVRTDRHSWKWRLSRNNFRVTHGINKAARIFDDKTGRTYSKKGMSDGCEYVDVMTGEFLPHKGFYTKEIEELRLRDPKAYGDKMNAIFQDIPSIFHYSWANIPRKIRNFKEFWDRCWSNLYNDQSPVDRFPGVHTAGDMIKIGEEMRRQGGEHGPSMTFSLHRSSPAIMKDWTGVSIDVDRPDHHDEGSTRPTQTDTGLAVEDDQTRSVSAHDRP